MNFVLLGWRHSPTLSALGILVIGIISKVLGSLNQDYGYPNHETTLYDKQHIKAFEKLQIMKLVCNFT